MSDHNNNGDDQYLYKYFSHILDLISDGIYISDRNGQTLRINSMYERLTGLNKERLIGQNVEILTEEGLFDTILHPRIVKTGKPATSVQTDRKNKKLVLNGYPIFDENGDVALVVTFVRNVTLMAQLREQIISQRRLIEKYRTNVQYLVEESEQKRPLIAHSYAMAELIRKIDRLAGTDATILLQGETGVGKDVFAHRLHNASNRSGKPFVKVDCPTIPESLFESELFGYAPGAFSGAHSKGKLGFFEMAEKGTLFLDEIGELPLVMQAKLLRVLQDREIIRVGSTKTRKVDVRVVSATNRDLEEEVRQGRFRRDLYYRLHVAVITIPPLRERREDIVPLANHFLERFASRYKKRLKLTSDAQQAFHNSEWPGNIRELENLVQSLVITHPDGDIGVSALPSNMVGPLAEACLDPNITEDQPQPSATEDLVFPNLMTELQFGNRSLKSIMGEIERSILKRTLSHYGSHAKVAKRLKVDRSTLFRKLRNRRN